MGVRALQRTQQEALNFLQGMKMRRTERLDYRRLDSGSFDNLQASSPGTPPQKGEGAQRKRKQASPGSQESQANGKIIGKSAARRRVHVRRSGLAPVKLEMRLEAPSEDSTAIADLLHFYETSSSDEEPPRAVCFMDYFYSAAEGPTEGAPVWERALQAALKELPEEEKLSEPQKVGRSKRRRTV